MNFLLFHLLRSTFDVVFHSQASPAKICFHAVEGWLLVFSILLSIAACCGLQLTAREGIRRCFKSVENCDYDYERIQSALAQLNIRASPSRELPWKSFWSGKFMRKYVDSIFIGYANFPPSSRFFMSAHARYLCHYTDQLTFVVSARIGSSFDCVW